MLGAREKFLDAGRWSSTRSSPQPNPTQAEQRTEIILDSDECMLYDAYI